VRFVFFGSPPFGTAVLARLLASDHRALALVTPPDRPRGRGRSVEPSELVQLARGQGVPVLQPAEPHDDETMGALRELAADVHVVASYGVLMKAALLDLPAHGSLNVHASLLPRHRGASPIQAAILAGDAVTGVCVQRMVLALDEGDVLVAKERPLDGSETSVSLLADLARLGGEAAVQALDQLASGAAVFTPQDPEQATYARKLTKERGHLDFGRPADELERLVRACTPWPGARCADPRGRVLTVHRAALAPELDAAAAGAPPGTLLAADRRLVVATGAGALELLELQPAGKRALPADAYLRGARLNDGERLLPLELAS
jgi:methionyl-tRNA formyltransferase